MARERGFSELELNKGDKLVRRGDDFGVHVLQAAGRGLEDSECVGCRDEFPQAWTTEERHAFGRDAGLTGEGEEGRREKRRGTF